METTDTPIYGSHLSNFSPQRRPFSGTPKTTYHFLTIFRCLIGTFVEHSDDHSRPLFDHVVDPCWAIVGDVFFTIFEARLGRTFENKLERPCEKPTQFGGPFFGGPPWTDCAGVAQLQTDGTQPIFLHNTCHGRLWATDFPITVSDLATLQKKIHWPVGTERKRRTLFGDHVRWPCSTNISKQKQPGDDFLFFF